MRLVGVLTGRWDCEILLGLLITGEEGSKRRSSCVDIGPGVRATRVPPARSVASTLVSRGGAEGWGQKAPRARRCIKTEV